LRLHDLEERVVPSFFNDPAVITATGYQYRADYSALGDFNEDGKLDVCTVDNYAPAPQTALSVLLGNGDGTFHQASGSPFQTEMNTVFGWVVAKDFDGDGHLDLAIVDLDLVVVYTYHGNGDGTFTQTATSPRVGGSGYLTGMVSGDFNGDGLPDLAIPDIYANAIYLLKNTGGGNFATWTSIPSPHGGSLAVGDFNGDGKTDIAAGDGQANTVSLFLGNGDGTFSAGPGSPYTTSVHHLQLVATDLNGDGKLDVAAVGDDGSSHGMVQTFLGVGTGALTPQSPTTISGVQGLYFPSATAIKANGGPIVNDYNHDGSPDLIACALGTNYTAPPEVLLGDGSGSFNDGGPATQASIQDATSALGGDFNGDGSVDVAVLGNVNNYGSVFAYVNSYQAPKTDTTTSLQGPPSPVYMGQQVTFTATVSSVGSGTPTGSVMFKDNGVALADIPLDGNGQATLKTSVLAAGNHTLTATYDGDSSFNPSTSSPVSLNVLKYVTTTTLQSSFNPSVSGEPVTFTATVTPAGGGTPTGTVGIYDSVFGFLGSGNLDGGRATFTNTVALGVGTHQITAVYDGDSNFNSSTSSALNQIVRYATVFTWSGLGADGQWTRGANWVGGVAPAPGDSLVFPEAAERRTNFNDYPDGSIFTSITFNGVSPGFDGYHISGNAVTIGAGGLIDKASDPPYPVYDTIGCNVAATSPDLTVATYNRAILILTGNVTGSARLVKTGYGGLRLIGGNDYTNTTVIQQGFIFANNPYALGSTTAGTVVGRNGVLYVGPDAGRISEPLVFQPAANTQAVQFKNWDGTNEWAGPILIPSAGLGIEVHGQLTLTGGMSGPGTVRSFNNHDNGQDYNGRLVLPSKNTFQGGLTLFGGTIDLQDSLAAGTGSGFAGGITVHSGATLQVDGTQSFAYNLVLAGGTLESLNGNNIWTGPIYPLRNNSSTIQADTDALNLSGQISGSGSLHKTGEAVVTLSAKNFDDFGDTYIDAGVLLVAADDGLGILGTGVFVGNGGTLAFGIDYTTYQPLTIAGAGGNNSGAILVGSGRNVHLNGGIKLVDSASIRVSSGGTLTVDRKPISGADTATLTKVGPGTLTLEHANTYAGPSDFLEGLVVIQDYQALGPNGSAGTTVYQGATLQLASPGVGFEINEELTLDGRSGSQPVLENANGYFDWQGNITLLSTSAVSVGGQVLLKVSGNIDGMPGAGLVKVGSGEVVLGRIATTHTSTFTYTGLTEIQGGILQAIGDHSTSAFQVDSGGTLFLNYGATTGAVTTTGGIVSLEETPPSTTPDQAAPTVTDLTVTPGSFFQYNHLPRMLFVPPTQINVSGSVTLGGSLDLEFTTQNAPPATTSFTLIHKTSAGAINGTFAGLAEGATFPVVVSPTITLTFRITYLGNGGNDVVVTRLS
jgi:autotransporter-associated beta strand protein